MSENTLKITAYDRPSGNRVKSEIDTFSVDFNPNTFTLVNKIEFEQADAQGSAGSDPQFKKIPPIEFSIEFLLDGTGVAVQNFSPKHQEEYKSKKKDYVKAKVKELRQVTGSDLNGEIHRPNYLAVQWGTFDIKCVLTSLSIAYNLFDKDGTPLRAKITCSFLERMMAGENARRSQLESPDLTKHFVVRQSDVLPLIAKENYESSSYYLQIAKANKLKNFRRISPGTELILPPMREENE
jgi:nucleoid-associated protein YgaU